MILLRILLAIIGIIISTFGQLNADEPQHQQEQGGYAIDLEKIVVTNKRAAASPDEAAEDITIVGEGRIASLPAENLGEALSYIGGVDIAPNKGFGAQSAVSIQGCDPRQVRVMIDGITLNTQSSGEANLAEFPLENIGRIEIIKGPGSSVWGSGLGGVINVITKDTGNTLIPKGSVSSSFAGFHTNKETAELSGKVSGLGYYLLSNYLSSGGNGPRSDTLEKNAFGKLSYDLKASGKLSAVFGYNGGDVNTGFPDSTWQAQSYRERYGKIGWENDVGPAGLKVDLKHLRKDIVTKYFYTSFDIDTPDARITTKDLLYQLSLNSSLNPRKVDLLVAGMDIDNDAVKSNTYLTKAKSLKIYAPYANYTLKLNPWDINFGLRYDNNSEFGADTSPSIGAVYHFKNLPDTLVRAGISHAFNAPPLLWKYNDNGINTIANPDLKAERAMVYEAGLETRIVPRLWFKFSLYRSDVKDAVETAYNDANQSYKKKFQKVRRQGMELESSLEIFHGLFFKAGAGFNDIEDRATRRIIRGGGKPRQSFNTSIEYKAKCGLSVSLIGYYNRWNESAALEPNDRKMLCDLKISQDWKMLKLFMNIHNLNNSKYWADSFLPIPPRYFEGGLSINW